jgi:hypothetical protein
MTGSVTAPAGYTISSKTVAMTLGTTAGLNLLSENNAAASFTYAMPVITGATFRVGVAASKASTGNVSVWKGSVAGNATGVAITIQGCPELSLPINAATNVGTSTPFSWTQFTGGVHLLIYTAVGKPSYYIVTTATSDSIPNLSAAGLGLPASTAYQWAVYGFGPFADVDAATGAEGFLGVLAGAVSGDASFAVTSPRSFTTAP